MVSGFSIVYNCTNHKNHLLLGVNAWWKLKRLYFRFRAVNLKYFLLKSLYVVLLLNWNYFRVHFFLLNDFIRFQDVIIFWASLLFISTLGKIYKIEKLIYETLFKLICFWITYFTKTTFSVSKMIFKNICRYERMTGTRIEKTIQNCALTNLSNYFSLQVWVLYCCMGYSSHI